MSYSCWSDNNKKKILIAMVACLFKYVNVDVPNIVLYRLIRCNLKLLFIIFIHAHVLYLGNELNDVKILL